MGWTLHRPLIKVLMATSLTLAAVFAIHIARGEIQSLLTWTALAWIFAGALYTHLFEYFYHLQMMHRVIRIGTWRYYDPRHQRHHQLFVGERFRTRNADDLAEVTTSWYTFPVLFAAHYLAFRALFAAEYAPAFFLGVSVQFLAYESTHWMTHLRDNAVDRWVKGIPVLGELRRRQVEHHLTHHKQPNVNFNFTPPYVGDRVGRTRSAKAG